MSAVWPVVTLLPVAVLYAAGRPGRVDARAEFAFYGGLIAIAVALGQPVDRFADRLFWAHMVQHVLLTMVAPPLLILGRPWPRVIRPLPHGLRRSLALALLRCRAVAAPLPAFVLFNGVLLAWHVPTLYDLTLRSLPVHVLEHGLFVGTGLLFWAQLVPTSRRPRLSPAQRSAYGIGAILAGWGLALVLAVASHPLYAHYAALAHRPGGLSALADQQLASGIMWVPASVPLTIAVLVAAYRWLESGATQAHAPDLRPRET